MRQHRERLYNEHTRFEVEEHAVGLLGKAVGKITGMFRTPEAVPQKSPQTEWEPFTICFLVHSSTSNQVVILQKIR